MNVKKSQIKKIAVVFLLLSVFGMFSVSLHATENFYLTSNGLALGGVDPVSYHTMDAPVAGLKKHEYKYGNAVFRFATAENLDMFRQQPEKYIPRFGGYCAYGVRVGKKSVPDPTHYAYSISDGDLYILFNQATKRIWEKNTERNIEVAERLWSDMQTKQGKSD